MRSPSFRRDYSKKIKLPNVAMQILFGDVVIDAHDAVLNQREGTLDGVSVNFAAHVFSRAVAYALMARVL